MRSYYSDNAMFLREKYPSIYEVVRQQETDFDKYQLVKSKNGLPNIALKTDSGVSYLYSQYDPEAEAQRWLESVHDQAESAKNILMFGFGLGYHAEALLNVFPDKRLYIYEPDILLFKAAMEGRNLKPILNNRSIGTFAIGAEPYVYSELMDIIATTVFESFTVLSVPVYQRRYKAIFQALREEAEKILLTYRGNLVTNFHFQNLWAYNILKNFPHIVQTPDITLLEGVCKDIPAIIVGSGPSLGEDIPVLKTLKGRCMIIAAGTSVQALAKHKIVPDLVISIDGGEPNYKAFKDIDLTKMPFLYSSTVHEKILDKPIAAPIYVQIGVESITPYLLEKRYKIPEFLSTASVTGIAIQAAVYFGCNPIVFTGQDMSYPNDSFYTDGIAHIDKEVLDRTIASATEAVENVSGGMNKTTKKMLNTLDDIERLLSLYPHKTFYNSSRYGAKIKGTEFVPLEKWAEKLSLPKRDEHWFFDICSGLKTDPQRLNYGLKQITKLLQQLQSQSILINDFYIHFNDLKAALRRSDSNRVISLLNIVEIQWDEISSNALFQKVISLPLRGYITIFTRFVSIIAGETNPMKKAELIVTHMTELVETMVAVIPQLIKWTESALEELRSLQQEEGDADEQFVLR